MSGRPRGFAAAKDKAASMRVKAAAVLELRRREWVARALGFRGDPVGYVRSILGMEVTPTQRDILESLAKHSRVAAKSHHSLGKTFVAALATSYHYDTLARSIIYITAPSWHQAKELTFKQVILIRREHVPAFARGEILDAMIRDEDKTERLRHYIKPLNAEKGEGFQGEHSAPILVVMEEATGIPLYIADATEGLMTGDDCLTLAIANPLDEATPFGSMCRDPRFKVIEASAFDHPNVKAELLGQERPFPGAVTLRWVHDQMVPNCEPARPGDPSAFEWYSIEAIEAVLAGSPVQEQEGPLMAWWSPNAFFQSRVLGMFPGQATDSVIPKAWLDAQKPLEPDITELPEVGVDCARSGDDRTCICTRWGPCVWSIEEIRQMDQDLVVGRIRDAIHAAASIEGRRFDPKQVPCRIDVTGGLGTGPADRLTNEGYRISPINSAESAADTEQYPNKRSELWFSAREAARLGRLDLSRLPMDLREKVKRELTAPKWAPTKKGLKEVEPKKQTKKMLGHSPDLADALNLAYYFGEGPQELTRVDGSALSINYARLGSRGR